MRSHNVEVFNGTLIIAHDESIDIQNERIFVAIAKRIQEENYNWKTPAVMVLTRKPQATVTFDVVDATTFETLRSLPLETVIQTFVKQ